MDTMLHDLDFTLATAIPPKWTSHAILPVGDQSISQESAELTLIVVG